MMGEDKPPDRVRLPRSFFASLPGSRSAVRLAISVLDIGAGDLFKGPQLRLEDGSSVLNNHMVGLSVGRTPVTRLPEPLEITFSHQRQPPNATLTCVFWDVNKGPAGDWDSKGCSTELGAEGTVCHCDHLTFFALLLRPVLDRATAQVLTHISQAGCGVSMIFLAFTIVLYLTLRACELGLEYQEECHQDGAWQLRRGGHLSLMPPPGSPTLPFLRFSLQRFKSEDAPKIHVALSSSLFLLNLAFLVSVGSGSAGSRAACWIRGAIFHYFLLCTFTWMGLEAFHLYLLVIKVFNTYFGHYYLKLSLVGWGLPALMVIGTGSANSYGLYTIRDQENRTSLELCWFQKEPALYATVHGYFLITFLFGAVVLALVAWKIFTLSSVTAGKEQGQSWKAVLTILGLSSLVSSSSAGLPSSTSRVRSPRLLPRGALAGWTRPPLCPMSRWPRPCAQTHLPSAVCPQQLLRMQGPRLLPLYGAAEEETGWILWPQRSHPDMSTDPRVPGCRCARDLGLQS
ncbi:adhesion G protein-coupled receptor G3 isoform X5 [Marmota monax]|nr:adhesion G protein-coupled receptor G3 isoform X5 [Marmota monax]